MMTNQELARARVNRAIVHHKFFIEGYPESTKQRFHTKQYSDWLPRINFPNPLIIYDCQWILNCWRL